MDLMNYLISVTIIALAIGFGEFWMAIGVTLILIIASHDIKASILMIVSLLVFFFINSIGLKEYWFLGIVLLLIFGYLLGLGKEEAPADPYAGLLGGGAGLMG